jgi:hypothetical protein
VAVLATGSAKADITYTLVNSPPDQGVHTVSGSITTDGNTGVLTIMDIKSWTVTIDTTTIRSSDVDALTLLLGTGLIATSTELTLANPTATGSNDFGLETVIHGTALADTGIKWTRQIEPPPALTIQEYEGQLSGVGLWLKDNPYMGTTDPWVIATVVPEPSTAIVAAFGAVAFIAYGWSRYRRGQRQRREKGTSQSCSASDLRV